MEMVFVLGATLFIAYANGANDNYKGVATLFGSGTTGFKAALHWANWTTLLGSLSAFYLSGKLIKTFSGKGLVPEALVGEPVFMISVILGAGCTVFFAARTGIPISTTHSLTGALAGSGFAAIGTDLAGLTLTKKFFIPLILSPLIAVALTAVLYALMKMVKRISGLRRRTCVCIGERVIPVAFGSIQPGMTTTVAELRKMDILVDSQETCEAKAVSLYPGKLFGISFQSILDGLHYFSSGAVGFARGLNDTPKIVALSVAAGTLGLGWNIWLVAVAMLLGGWLSSRKVAHTLSHKITPMSHGQGFTANLVTAVLVIFASKFGVPVSTTHVSCGSLFGIGMVSGKGHWHMIRRIIGAWLLTLPVAAGFSFFIFTLFGGVSS